MHHWINHRWYIYFRFYLQKQGVPYTWLNTVIIFKKLNMKHINEVCSCNAYVNVMYVYLRGSGGGIGNFYTKIAYIKETKNLKKYWKIQQAIFVCLFMHMSPNFISCKLHLDSTFNLTKLDKRIWICHFSTSPCSYLNSFIHLLLFIKLSYQVKK